MNFQDIDSEALRITTECYERAKQVPLLGEHVKKHMEITSSYYYFFFSFNLFGGKNYVFPSIYGNHT